MQMEFPLIVTIPENDKVAQLEYLICSVKDSNKRVTRRLWAENNRLNQLCKELEERMKIIEKNLCTG